MDSRGRSPIWRSKGLKLLFPILLTLSVLNFTGWVSSHAQGQSRIVEYTIPWPEGKGDPFCFDLPEVQELMKKAKEYPFLAEENKALREENTKLEEQFKDQAAVTQIQEQWRKLAEEKVAFYKDMAQEYRKLSDKQNEVIERQDKQLQRKILWDTVGGIFLFAAGLFAGINF